MTNAISVEGVSKRFRIYKNRNQSLKGAFLQRSRAQFEEFWALDDVSFEIPQGKTFGLLGLGRIGTRVASYAQAFGMDVIASSQNLTVQAAAEVGVTRVEKKQLFERSDVLSVHLALSKRTTGLVGAGDLARMKSTAVLVNTARGQIVDQDALAAALVAGRLAGAGLDVFDQEPLPEDDSLLDLSSVTLTPNAGYSSPEVLAAMYATWPEAISAYASGSPIRVLNPEALRTHA